MVKKLLALLFASVLIFSLSTSVLAQDQQEDAKEATAHKKKAAKEARWEGVVTRSNKDKSTLTVRSTATNIEKTVQYDSSTRWTSQEHHSKKINQIDASQVDDNDRVICIGTWDKDGVLHATLISKRLTK
jgi:hypothetical protein